MPVFTATLFTREKTWKQPRYPPIDEWINQKWYMHKMECYAAINYRLLEAEGMGVVES